MRWLKEKENTVTLTSSLESYLRIEHYMMDVENPGYSKMGLPEESEHFRGHEMGGGLEVVCRVDWARIGAEETGRTIWRMR